MPNTLLKAGLFTLAAATISNAQEITSTDSSASFDQPPITSTTTNDDATTSTTVSGIEIITPSAIEVFIPPYEIGDMETIYASIITTYAGTTEYLLTCPTYQPTCSGNLKDATLTYGPEPTNYDHRSYLKNGGLVQQVGIDIADKRWDCELDFMVGGAADCTTKKKGQEVGQAVKIDMMDVQAAETYIYVVNPPTETTTSQAQPTETEGSCRSLCKRAKRVKYKGGGGDGDDDECSAASKAKVMGVGAVGVLVGGFLGAAILL